MATKQKLPKTLAGCADALYTTQTERYALQRQAAELEKFEKELKEHIIQNLPKSAATGIAGKIARVLIVSKSRMQIKSPDEGQKYSGGWDEFYAYVKKNNAFYLLQKRLSEPAIKEILEAGKKVPGVEEIAYRTVSLHKI
jgi:hypothetical protein